LGAEEPECFTFTSGATESNNWVLLSLLAGRQRGRVVISAIEHASVSEPAAEMVRRGFEVTEVPVDGQGVVRLDALRNALGGSTALVSIMAANNETGVLEPIPEIGQLIRENAPTALFHTDATQAIGKVPIDLQGDWSEVDLVSFSAHKFHGPKGIGGLYIRPGVSIDPMILGGGQEAGLRSGTSNTPALAGLAAAAEECPAAFGGSIAAVRDRFELELEESCPGVVFHSRCAQRLPNTSCFSLPGLVGEDIAHTLAAEGIIVGTGSACSSGAIHPPKTLLAMGTEYSLARAAIRVSLSMMSTYEDLSMCLDRVRTLGRP
jgi:cysteine desulfurase